MINKKDIHESAYIDNNVSIGKNTKVWHFSHICENVKIGNDCIIGQNVMIGPELKLEISVKFKIMLVFSKVFNLEMAFFVVIHVFLKML